MGRRMEDAAYTVLGLLYYAIPILLLIGICIVVPVLAACGVIGGDGPPPESIY